MHKTILPNFSINNSSQILKKEVCGNYDTVIFPGTVGCKTNQISHKMDRGNWGVRDMMDYKLFNVNV